MRLPEPTLTRPAKRVPIALPPGAVTLIGDPSTGGFAWAGRFASQAESIVALIRRAIATEEGAVG
jgi:hypothetical protein